MSSILFNFCNGLLMQSDIFINGKSVYLSLIYANIFDFSALFNI